jgi:tRNA/rRNA methyltransferase
MLVEMENVLVEIGFLDPANPKRLMPRLRRFFARAGLEKEEVAIWRGILSAARSVGSIEKTACLKKENR